jgi:hypothetical protein
MPPSSTPTVAECFVSYDIRAIQSFIFRVPKLRHISGGSAMVDEFDRDIAPALGARHQCDVILAAGGKGCFRCSDPATAEQLQRQLIEAAHRFGMDIRLGNEPTFASASRNATKCYSFMPAQLDGEPCQASGLFPVSQGSDHPSIKQRTAMRGTPRHRRFEARLLDGMPELRALAGKSVRFLSHVSQESEHGVDPVGDAGLAALGQRHRWAVITMDGNDMGRQHEVARANDPDPIGWVKQMSKALDGCCIAAVRAGLRAVFSRWEGSLSDEERSRCTVTDEDGDDKAELVIPFRPLLVGGDDIVVLCHAHHAFDFVREATAAWQRESQKAFGGFAPSRLWPATGGSTTISAGVLFCPVSMPLHSAIPYSEELLALAKGRGRAVNAKSNDDHKPCPACIDWESVTESVLDHPEHRRRRELEFRDGDDGNALIRLTKRPYTLQDFEALYAAAGMTQGPSAQEPILPEARSALAALLPAMRQAKSDRMLAALRLRKRGGAIADIVEGPGRSDRGVLGWSAAHGTHTVGLLDAVAILEECERSVGLEDAQ